METLPLPLPLGNCFPQVVTVQNVDLDLYFFFVTSGLSRNLTQTLLFVF